MRKGSPYLITKDGKVDTAAATKLLIKKNEELIMWTKKLSDSLAKWAPKEEDK